MANQDIIPIAEFKSRVVMITGAGQGIGRAYAHRFAALGARVVVAEIGQEAGRRVSDEIGAMGAQALAVQVDVSSEESVAAAVGAAAERFGKIDVLVNNAAIFSTLKMRPFEEIPLDEWRRVLDVNITGTFLMTRAVAPLMKAAGWGRIINVSSAAVTMGRPHYLHYTTSKAAAIGMTRSLARELGPHGITVNVVLPGAVDTGIPRETVSPEQKKAQIAMRSIQREQTPDDMVGVVQFLASDASAFVTGQSLTVDGGLTFL
ncbi:MAG: short-chain dehydrogenase [Noviherbaspirillum sp.]|jgi:3-oxoacyl-[acyl-carrier protein] reductase|nr:short-chain dehydrogenase [Noviherbaspirillum sp.]